MRRKTLPLFSLPRSFFALRDPLPSPFFPLQLYPHPKYPIFCLSSFANAVSDIVAGKCILCIMQDHMPQRFAPIYQFFVVLRTCEMRTGN